MKICKLHERALKLDQVRNAMSSEMDSIRRFGVKYVFYTECTLWVHALYEFQQFMDENLKNGDGILLLDTKERAEILHVNDLQLLNVTAVECPGLAYIEKRG